MAKKAKKVIRTESYGSRRHEVTPQSILGHLDEVSERDPWLLKAMGLDDPAQQGEAIWTHSLARGSDHYPGPYDEWN